MDFQSRINNFYMNSWDSDFLENRKNTIYFGGIVYICEIMFPYTTLIYFSLR